MASGRPRGSRRRARGSAGRPPEEAGPADHGEQVGPDQRAGGGAHLARPPGDLEGDRTHEVDDRDPPREAVGRERHGALGDLRSGEVARDEEAHAARHVRRPDPQALLRRRGPGRVAAGVRTLSSRVPTSWTLLARSPRLRGRHPAQRPRRLASALSASWTSPLSASSHWSEAAPVKNTAPTANRQPRRVPSSRAPPTAPGNEAAKAPTVKQEDPQRKAAATHHPGSMAPRGARRRGGRRPAGAPRARPPRPGAAPFGGARGTR